MKKNALPSFRAPPRRDFLRAAGATRRPPPSRRAPSPSPPQVRYAIVGAGHRGSGMGRGSAAAPRPHVGLVGLCDVNPSRGAANA
jgi:hypothetical protein